ncbi:MAG: DUF6263 family protein [Planctomycetaceae bacterium]
MVHRWHSRFGATAALVALALIASNRWQARGNEPSATSDDSQPPAPAPPDVFWLRYKFTPGQIATYEVSHEMRIRTHYNDADETHANKSRTKRRYKVVSADETGAADLELAIDWVRMEAAFGNGVREAEPIVFQSDDPAKQPEKFKPILATVGRPTAVIRFSASGRPLKVDAKEPALPAPQAGAASGPDTSHESYLVALPERPVAVGDVWKERFEIAARDSDRLPVRVAMQRTYKLAKVENDLATIEFRSAILTPIEAPSILAQLIQRETAGSIVFDLNRGLVVSREVDVDRTVIGPLGPKSSLRAVSKWREKLLTEVIAETAADALQATTRN